MVAEKVADFCQAAPFRPFELFLPDGRKWLVNHPDYVSLDTRNEAITVYDEETDFADVIDLFAIVSVRYLLDALE